MKMELNPSHYYDISLSSIDKSSQSHRESQYQQQKSTMITLRSFSLENESEKILENCNELDNAEDNDDDNKDNRKDYDKGGGVFSGKQENPNKNYQQYYLYQNDIFFKPVKSISQSTTIYNAGFFRNYYETYLKMVSFNSNLTVLSLLNIKKQQQLQSDHQNKSTFHHKNNTRNITHQTLRTRIRSPSPIESSKPTTKSRISSSTTTPSESLQHQLKKPESRSECVDYDENLTIPVIMTSQTISKPNNNYCGTATDHHFHHYYDHYHNQYRFQRSVVPTGLTLWPSVVVLVGVLLCCSVLLLDNFVQGLPQTSYQYGYNHHHHQKQQSSLQQQSSAPSPYLSSTSSTSSSMNHFQPSSTYQNHFHDRYHPFNNINNNNKVQHLQQQSRSASLKLDSKIKSNILLVDNKNKNNYDNNNHHHQQLININSNNSSNNISCPNCRLRLNQTQAEYLKLEAIKQQILSKLNLVSPPRITQDKAKREQALEAIRKAKLANTQRKQFRTNNVGNSHKLRYKNNKSENRKQYHHHHHNNNNNHYHYHYNEQNYNENDQYKRKRHSRRESDKPVHTKLSFSSSPSSSSFTTALLSNSTHFIPSSSSSSTSSLLAHDYDHEHQQRFFDNYHEEFSSSSTDEYYGKTSEIIIFAEPGKRT